MSALPAPVTLAEVVLDYFRDRDWIAGRRAAFQIALCHSVDSTDVLRTLVVLAKRGRIECRKSIAVAGAREYRLPGPPPESRVSPSVSPFQRCCDVLRAYPERSWTIESLSRLTQLGWAETRSCIARLELERVLLRDGRRWRTADVPAGSPGWWWAPGERAPIELRQRRRQWRRR